MSLPKTIPSKLASTIKGLALMEHMEDREAPKLNDIRELLLNAIFSTEEDGIGSQGVISGLLDAYNATLIAKLEAEEKEAPAFLTNSEAEDTFREACIDAVQVQHKEGSHPDFNRDRVAEWFMWPDCMSLTDNWPPGLLRRIGWTMGIREERRVRQITAYYQKHDQTLSPEELTEGS